MYYHTSWLMSIQCPYSAWVMTVPVKVWRPNIYNRRDTANAITTFSSYPVVLLETGQTDYQYVINYYK